MPRLCPCPRCFRDLTIPDLADEESRLVCPFCREAFSAAEVQGSGDPLPPAAILVAPESQAGFSTPSAGAVAPPTQPSGAVLAPTGEQSAEPQPPSAGSQPHDGISEALALPSQQDSSAAEVSAEAGQAAGVAGGTVEAGRPRAIEQAEAGEAPHASVLAEGYDPLALGAYEVSGSHEAYAPAAAGDSGGERRAASGAEHDRDYAEHVAAGPAQVEDQGQAPPQEAVSPWSDVPAYGDAGSFAGAEDDLTPSPHQYWSDDSSSDLGRTAEADEESSSGRLAEYEPPRAVDVRTASRPRRRTGMLGQMLGVVAGGALGVAIGYYLLVLILGARGDFLELRSKLPSWLLPGERTRPEEQDPDANRTPRRPGRPGGRSETIEREAAIPPRQVGGRALGEGRTKNLNREAALPWPGNVLHASYTGADAPQRGRSGRREPGRDTEFDQGMPGNSVVYTPREVQQRAAAVAAAIGCPRYTNHAEPAAPAASNEANTAGQAACAACVARAEGGLSLRAYAELCRLAEAVTLLRAPQDEAERAQLRAAVCDVLACVIASPGRLPVLGRLAAERMRSTQRSRGGIALAGTVRAIECGAERCTLTIVLFGEPVVVTVVAPVAPATPVMPGDRVLVLGFLSDEDDAAAGGAASGNGRMVQGGLCLPIAVVHAATRPMRSQGVSRKAAGRSPF